MTVGDHNSLSIRFIGAEAAADGAWDDSRKPGRQLWPFYMYDVYRSEFTSFHTPQK